MTIIARCQDTGHITARTGSRCGTLVHKRVKNHGPEKGFWAPWEGTAGAFLLLVIYYFKSLWLLFLFCDTLAARLMADATRSGISRVTLPIESACRSQSAKCGLTAHCFLFCPSLFSTWRWGIPKRYTHARVGCLHFFRPSLRCRPVYQCWGISWNIRTLGRTR